MTFSVTDYERATVRIFSNDKNVVVGTGFLVAPGYVLTCAHVVLEAVGIPKTDIETHKDPSTNIIRLNFHILAPNAMIEARVIDWVPYQLNMGDIAGLKLLSPAPDGVRPIHLLETRGEDVEADCHLVYGFGSPEGGRSDAYRPKTQVTDERWQLCKYDDPNDETIRPGFSGAPLWNDRTKAVLGMIATAAVKAKEDLKSTAYAIPTSKLRPVLNTIDAHYVADVLEEHWDQSQLTTIAETAFQLCDSDGDKAKHPELRDRLTFLSSLSNREWWQNDREVDRLTQFVMFVIVLQDNPAPSLLHALKTWVTFRQFDFEKLYFKADQYRKKRKISATQTQEHLVIQIKADEQDPARANISIWIIRDRDRYDPLEPPKPSLSNEAIALVDLADFLDQWISSQDILDEPMLHCFVARSQLSSDLDACGTQSGLTLGNQYQLVMRTDLSQSPTSPQYYRRWQQKWQSLENNYHSQANGSVVRADSRKSALLFKQFKSAEIGILENLSSDRTDAVFKFLADKVALPVVLWARKENLCSDIDRILDCTVIDLPKRVLEERQEAIEDEEKVSLGYHLSLVWDDPKVVPPTMMAQIDPEMC
ncbi:MAG TPA: trypsin-like peptidase domain-containing protein [Candidatus Obscuribacterales bacterium]